MNALAIEINAAKWVINMSILQCGYNSNHGAADIYHRSPRSVKLYGSVDDSFRDCN